MVLFRGVRASEMINSDLKNNRLQSEDALFDLTVPSVETMLLKCGDYSDSLSAMCVAAICA